jgi:hypothetical protein
VTDAHWYYCSRGVPHGPYTAAQLEGQFAASRLPATTPLWRHGLPDWRPANHFAELEFLASPQYCLSARFKAALPPALTIAAISFAGLLAVGIFIATRPTSHPHPLSAALGLAELLLVHVAAGLGAAFLAALIRRPGSVSIVVACYLLAFVLATFALLLLTALVPRRPHHATPPPNNPSAQSTLAPNSPLQRTRPLPGSQQGSPIVDALPRSGYCGRAAERER